MSEPLPDAPAAAAPQVSFAEALRFWFKLGLISFGGPAGQIAIMHRVLVEERRWVSEGRFLHALNYCMVLPGPEAQQLATYLGWLMHRTRGGIAAGALFVLPSLLLLMGLSALVVRFGDTPTVQAVFYGVKPAVVVLVAAAAWRLGRATLKSGVTLAIAVAAFAAVSLGLPFPAVLAAAAATGWLAQRLGWPGFDTVSSAANAHTGKSTAHVPGVSYLIDDDTAPPPHAQASLARTLRVLAGGVALALAAWGAVWAVWGHGVFTDLGAFFTRAALVTFGGAYAVLPYVTQQAVEHYHWLSAPQMIDGLALGESTPGPLIIIVAYVGFLGGAHQAGWAQPLAAGALGACVATFFTFLPSFIFIFAGAPWIEHTRRNIALHAPLRAISAAVVGVIVSLALYFATHVFWVQSHVEWGAVGIAVLAALMQFRWRWGVVRLVLACAALGACYIALSTIFLR